MSHKSRQPPPHRFRVVDSHRDQLAVFRLEKMMGLSQTQMQDVINSLTQQLAEADRRAGAAERMLESTNEDVYRLESCRRQYKKDWGVEDGTSFDDVWEEAKALKGAFDDALAHKVSKRIHSIKACAMSEIPLAKETFDHIIRDASASPELRSDAVRAFNGISRLQTMLAETKA